MAITVSSIISIAAFALSSALVALTAANFYLVSHGMQVMDYWFPEGRYEWWEFRRSSPFPMWPIRTDRNVFLEYDYSTEIEIIVATSFTILAAVAGIATFWVPSKDSKFLSKLASTSIALITSGLAFLTTIICLGLAADKHNELRGNCNARNGIIDNFHFTCTRELTACQILQARDGGITETNWADNRRCCRETKAARIMLIPFTVLTFVLVALYAAQLFLAKKKDSAENADERVERLQTEGE